MPSSAATSLPIPTWLRMPVQERASNPVFRSASRPAISERPRDPVERSSRADTLAALASLSSHKHRSMAAHALRRALSCTAPTALPARLALVAQAPLHFRSCAAHALRRALSCTAPTALPARLALVAQAPLHFRSCAAHTLRRALSCNAPTAPTPCYAHTGRRETGQPGDGTPTKPRYETRRLAMKTYPSTKPEGSQGQADGDLSRRRSQPTAISADGDLRRKRPS